MLLGQQFEEPAKQIPVVEDVDVLVVGGGMAGAGAAIAAARMGVQTHLLEYFGSLGGSATSGLVNTLCGLTNYRKPSPGDRRLLLRGNTQLVEGIGGEIVRGLVAEQGGAWNDGFPSFNPESLKLLLDRMMVEAGGHVLYYTQMAEPIVNENAVRGVVIHNKAGRQAIAAKVVVDCTGDGDVCAAANVPYELGDGKGGFQQSDLCFHVVNADPSFDRASVTAAAAAALRAGDGEKYGITRAACITENILIPGAYWFNWNGIGFPVNGLNPDHLTQAAIQGRQSSTGLLRFLNERIPGMQHARILATAAKIGVRETRRVLGDYVLTGEDVLAGRKFEDGIGVCAWPIERVTATGRTFGLLRDNDVYTIPYRCLLPQDVDNLLMAGRFVSATHEAQASIRVMGPALVMGQAAGTAAALSVQNQVSPRKLDVMLLQRELKSARAYLG